MGEVQNTTFADYNASSSETFRFQETMCLSTAESRIVALSICFKSTTCVSMVHSLEKMEGVQQLACNIISYIKENRIYGGPPNIGVSTPCREWWRNEVSNNK
jgi:hypothetical protein